MEGLWPRLLMSRGCCLERPQRRRVPRRVSLFLPVGGLTPKQAGSTLPDQRRPAAKLTTLPGSGSTIPRRAAAHASRASRFSSKYSNTSYTRLMPGLTCGRAAPPEPAPGFSAGPVGSARCAGCHGWSRRKTSNVPVCSDLGHHRGIILSGMERERQQRCEVV